MKIVTEKMLINDIIKMIDGNEHLELDRYMREKVLKDAMKKSGYKFCTGHYNKKCLRSERTGELLEEFYGQDEDLRKRFSESIYYYKPNGVIWFIGIFQSENEKMKTIIREMKKQEKYSYTL